MVEKKSSYQLQDAPLKSRRGSPDYLLRLAAKTQRFNPHKDAESPCTARSLKPSSKGRGARMKQSWRKWLNSAEIKEPIIHYQVAAAPIDQPVAVSLGAQLKSIKDETHHVPRFSSAPATSEQSGTSGEKSLKRLDHESSLIDEELECSGESPHPLEKKKTPHDVEFVWDELDLEWANVDFPSLLDVEATVGTSDFELFDFPSVGISNQHFAVLMKESVYQ